MTSFLSNNERSGFNSDFENLFDTLNRPIIVYKNPIKILKTQAPSDGQNFVYGFGEAQTENEYTYQQITGVFPALIRYQLLMARNVFRIPTETNIRIPEGGCSIKVRQDGKDFINNGATEKIVVDAKTYYLDSDEKPQIFLDDNFWVFVLKPTK